MYKLDLIGGQFVLVDGNTTDSNALTPITDAVTLVDNTKDPTFAGHDSRRLLGDAINDRFTVSDADSLNGQYTFVSLGRTQDSSGPADLSHLGFIAQGPDGQYYYFTENAVSASQVGLALTQQNGVVQICFMPGTLIRTPKGEVAVEALRIGDLVATHDGRAVPVRWIGRQGVAPRFADELRLPIRIKAGALADNVPVRDLVVSPDHALLVDGILVHAGALVNGASIVREADVPLLFTYYHVEVDDHSLILAEGAPAETFVDNVDRRRFDNFAEYEALYPGTRQIEEMPIPRAKAWRQVPRAVRDRLAERAVELVRAVARAA